VEISVFCGECLYFFRIIITCYIFKRLYSFYFILFYFILFYFILLNNQRDAALSGFGGLEVAWLAFGTQVRGFKPDRIRRIFWAKKSSARLPSEGK
jgi:hypothetical protein